MEQRIFANEQTYDEWLRRLCLEYAISLENKPEGFPEDVISHARNFYLFLNGQDPMVDIMGGAVPDSVILFSDINKMLDEDGA